MRSEYSNYSPTNDFIVFDIIINKYWGTWDDIIYFCNKTNLKHVPELFRGKWKDNRISIETLTSKLSIKKTPAEGIVIRVLNPQHDMKTRDKRIKWKCHGMLNEGILKDSDEDFTHTQKDNAITMMNQERFDSYVSKVGPEFIREKTNIGKNVKALVDDTMADIRESFPDFNSKSINKELSSKAFNYIKNF